MSDTTRSRGRSRRVLAGALGWLIVLLVLSGAGALLAVGANGPADPRLAPAGSSTAPTSSTATSVPAQVPVEFGEVAFQVTSGSGSGSGPGAGLPATTERCAQLAETQQQLQRGLMGRRDLGGYDAMIFRFASDTSGTFFMRNVPIALSIAWFDAEGRLVSTTDMEPCPDQEGCPQYAPAGPYRFALEVEQGGLSRLGITRSAVLRLGGACSRG